MPCNSDYLEPTYAEHNSRRVAALLVYVSNKLGRKIDPRYFKAASYTYGNSDLLNEMVVKLCSICSSMSKLEQDTIIYNARDKIARDLADWWEEHQEADRAREAKENEEKELTVLREKVLSKLSPKERKALGF